MFFFRDPVPYLFQHDYLCCLLPKRNSYALMTDPCNYWKNPLSESRRWFRSHGLSSALPLTTVTEL